MEIARLKHAGLELYKRPKSCAKWHLPVCSAFKKDILSRLRPNNVSRWEEVDFDGCPTMCYVMTSRLVRSLNSEKKFTSFYRRFADCLGAGPAKEFFPNLWIKDHNIRAHNVNTWEEHHGGLRGGARHGKSVSVREAAKHAIGRL